MIIRNLLLWVVACLFVVAANCPAAEKGKEEVDVHKLVMAARDLSERDAAKLEKILENDPEDFATRVTLIGYYSGKQYENEYAKKARVPHFMWVIEKRPESELSAFYMHMDPHSDGEAYFKAKKLWLEQVAKEGKNPAVLKNAANFMLQYDREKCEELLKKGQELEPRKHYWPKQLGFLYSLEMRHGSSEDERVGHAATALEYMERALGMMAERERMHELGDAAEAAFTGKRPDKARNYAGELLSLAEKYKDRGQPIHDGHIILGKLALAEEDVEAAVKHLIEAGQTEGSPVLGSFGPDFTLAAQLYDEGERKMLVKYFELCAKFWKMDDGRLKKWTVLVKNGVKPDF